VAGGLWCLSHSSLVSFREDRRIRERREVQQHYVTNEEDETGQEGAYGTAPALLLWTTRRTKGAGGVPLRHTIAHHRNRSGRWSLLVGRDNTPAKHQTKRMYRGVHAAREGSPTLPLLSAQVGVHGRTSTGSAFDTSL